MNTVEKVLKELINHPSIFTDEHEILLEVLLFCRNEVEPTTGKLLEHLSKMYNDISYVINLVHSG